jgi:hypothetical protein
LHSPPTPSEFISAGRYAKGITRRSHKVGDKTFNEETLPGESLAEYFEHFPVLEIDYTVYRPLVESKGSPAPKFHVLKTHPQQMKKEGFAPSGRDNIVEIFFPKG